MKWICTQCDGKESPCFCEMVGYNLAPTHCMIDGNDDAVWEEVKEEPTTNSSQLPKLTAEVFDRPDCPEWAMAAMVNGYGHCLLMDGIPNGSPGNGYIAYGKKTEPKQTWGIFNSKDDNGNFYYVERPAKLPDWCKVGEFGYDRNNKVYFKIKRINNESIVLQYPYNEDVESNLYIEFFMAQNPTQARMRPYNAEEMKDLAGKVVQKGRNLYLVTAYFEEQQSIIIASLSSALFDAELLIVNNITIDGSPCGVLEHLENGEWVK